MIVTGTVLSPQGKPVPAANVEFVKANKDYLKRLEPKLKALSQG